MDILSEPEPNDCEENYWGWIDYGAYTSLEAAEAKLKALRGDK